MEKLAVKHYSQNVKKGKEIIEHYINVLKEEGITYIAPFGSNKPARGSIDQLDVPFIDSNDIDSNHKNGSITSNFNHNSCQALSCDNGQNGESGKES